MRSRQGVLKMITSFERFMKHEDFEVEMGYNLTWEKLFQEDKECYELLNKSKPIDVGIIIHNRMNKIKTRLEDRVHPAWKICALFINEKDENRAVYDEILMKSKIDAWKKEYGVQGFFTLAVNLVNGFIPNYNEALKAISQQEQKLKDDMNSLVDQKTKDESTGIV